MKAVLSILALLSLAATAVLAEEEPDLDDPKVKAKILAAAVLRDTLEERGPEGEKLFYAPNSQNPISGWTKRVYDNGKVNTLGRCKDGKADGPFRAGTPGIEASIRLLASSGSYS